MPSRALPHRKRRGTGATLHAGTISSASPRAASCPPVDPSPAATARAHSPLPPCAPRRFKLKKVVSGPEAYTGKSLTVKAHAFTQSAREAIEGSGGTCVVLPKTAPAEAPAAAA